MVQMMGSCMGEVSPQIAANVRKWGALIETMHIASLAHDDIIDDSPSRRGVESQHLKYGKRSAVFSANFIISKAYILDYSAVLPSTISAILGCFRYILWPWRT
jgi:geranylgeranyl pyrophosphate synthase